ncbi:carboxypeptidase regulatory-like domain-containing protein [candidate division TA06 bacterium]|nr:carboxypeptidase regulatory-like domain-containing protein [candidate division TA06 bacterium]
MKKTNPFIVLLAFSLLAVLGCGPDAKRDNPLDPVNGRGVWGTVRNSKASPVPGAVVTARPVNINTVCDAQGAYSLDLTGGERYVLTVSHPQYRDALDTIDVPADGKLEKDFILTGKPSLLLPKVNTYVIAHENGTFDRGLKLECRGTHPDGQSYLGDYFFYSVVNNFNYPAQVTAFDSLSNSYSWDLNLGIIFGSVPDPETLIIGRPVFFIIEPGEGLSALQSFVPLFSSVPTNLMPNNGTLLTLPGTLSWTNSQASGVEITIEIWQGTQLKWSLTTASVSNVNCNASLVSGGYTWVVRTTDIDGNTAASEATFIIP